MKKVTVIDRPYTVQSGQVELTPEQARTRAHAIERVGKTGNVFQVIRPIQFKVGETFGFDGEVSKTGILCDPEAEALAEVEAQQAAVDAAFERGRRQGLQEATAAAEARADKAIAEAQSQAVALFALADRVVLSVPEDQREAFRAELAAHALMQGGD